MRHSRGLAGVTRLRRQASAVLFSLSLVVSMAASAEDLVPFSDIAPVQAAALMAAKGADPLFKVLDVRTAEEFAEGHIEGALNLDVQASAFKELAGKLDRGGTYLVYCRHGVRSRMAADLMREMGFARVYNLEGGITKWQEEQHPVEGAPAKGAAPAGCGGSGLASGSHAWLNGKKSTIVPFRLSSNLIHIEVEFNRTGKLDLTLDTGMPAPGALVLGQKAAAGLNLAYEGEARIAGAGSRSLAAKVAQGVTLRIGDLVLKDQPVVVTTDVPKGLSGAMGEGGGIGYALFGRFVVAIDYDRMLITLSEPEGYHYSGQGSTIPLSLESNFPFIDCTAVLANGTALALRMIVDLGAVHAFSLNPGTNPDLRVPDRSVPISALAAGSEVKGRLGRVRSFSVGRFSLESVLADFLGAKPMSLEKDGNLGSEILRRFNLVFDYSRRQLIVEPNTHFGEPFEWAMSGFASEKIESGEFVIRRVTSASPASEAGLREDDLIVEINGRPASLVSQDDLRRASLIEGARLELVVLRGESRLAVALKLRRLV